VVTLRFSETIKNTDPALVVSRRHEEWLLENDHPVYSQRALDFAHQMLTKRDRVRKGTFSASSLGECMREQQFTYLGMSKLPPDAKNAMKMQNGSFMHLRWQMAGLTEGWLWKAEVAVMSTPLGLQGTMDGVCFEDSILELKSINVNGFSRVTAFGPLHPHLFQMATYMLCTGRRKGIFIYECKDNQEYKEIPVTDADVPLDEAELQARAMWASVDQQKLFEPLEKCIDKTGWKYNSCPYRDRCLSIHEWGEVSG
jgi:hypothetical protein